MSGDAPHAASVVKRSVMIAGHRTSVSLEEPFWTALKDIAGVRGTSVQALVGTVDSGRGTANLSSALRVFVLRAVMERGRATGHRAAERSSPVPGAGDEPGTREEAPDRP